MRADGGKSSAYSVLRSARYATTPTQCTPTILHIRLSPHIVILSPAPRTQFALPLSLHEMANRRSAFSPRTRRRICA